MNSVASFISQMFSCIMKTRHSVWCQLGKGLGTREGGDPCTWDKPGEGQWVVRVNLALSPALLCKEQSHRRPGCLAWSHPSVWEKGTFGIELFYFQWDRSESNLKLIRQVNELNWLYLIIEITQPTVAIKKYQHLPCRLLLPALGIREWRCCGGLSSSWVPGPLACGRCLLTCLVFIVKIPDPNSVPLLGAPWGQGDLDAETWPETGGWC